MLTDSRCSRNCANRSSTMEGFAPELSSGVCNATIRGSACLPVAAPCRNVSDMVLGNKYLTRIVQSGVLHIIIIINGNLV